MSWVVVLSGPASNCEVASKRREWLKALGLKGNASHEEIERAHARLIRQWHPDRHLDDPVRATRRFQQIQNAYEELLLCARPVLSMTRFDFGRVEQGRRSPPVVFTLRADGTDAWSEFRAPTDLDPPIWKIDVEPVSQDPIELQVTIRAVVSAHMEPKTYETPLDFWIDDQAATFTASIEVAERVVERDPVGSTAASGLGEPSAHTETRGPDLAARAERRKLLEVERGALVRQARFLPVSNLSARAIVAGSVALFILFFVLLQILWWADVIPTHSYGRWLLVMLLISPVLMGFFALTRALAVDRRRDLEREIALLEKELAGLS